MKYVYVNNVCWVKIRLQNLYRQINKTNLPQTLMSDTPIWDATIGERLDYLFKWQTIEMSYHILLRWKVFTCKTCGDMSWIKAIKIPFIWSTRFQNQQDVNSFQYITVPQFKVVFPIAYEDGIARVKTSIQI